jgi:transposase-like protein
MKLERAEFIGAAPHERSASRRGWANGFKAKRVATRAGEIALSIPQYATSQRASLVSIPSRSSAASAASAL